MEDKLRRIGDKINVSNEDENLDINCAGCRAYLGGENGPATHTCNLGKQNKEEIKTTSQPAGAREQGLRRAQDWWDSQYPARSEGQYPTVPHALADYAAQQTAALTDKLCKIQDDIASLVSTHRSDWSWNDIIEDVKKLVEKQIVNEVTIGWLTKIVREQKGIIDLQTEVIEDLLKIK
jgi:hypothetical protein